MMTYMEDELKTQHKHDGGDPPPKKETVKRTINSAHCLRMGDWLALSISTYAAQLQLSW